MISAENGRKRLEGLSVSFLSALLMALPAVNVASLQVAATSSPVSATDHCRPPASLASEMAQSPAAANTRSVNSTKTTPARPKATCMPFVQRAVTDGCGSSRSSVRTKPPQSAAPSGHNARCSAPTSTPHDSRMPALIRRHARRAPSLGAARRSYAPPGAPTPPFPHPGLTFALGPFEADMALCRAVASLAAPPGFFAYPF